MAKFSESQDTQDARKKRRLRGHKGMGLLTALVVMLVGTGLCAAMFTFAVSFTHFSERFRRDYAERAAATGQIEQAKGLIVALNKEKRPNGPVLHGPGVRVDSDGNPQYQNINSLDDMRIEEYPYNPRGERVTVGAVVGARKSEPIVRWAVTEVFDANYFPAEVKRGVVTEKFPPSLAVDITLPGEYFEGPIYEAQVGARLKVYNRYGAYVIRVRIYDREPDPSNEERGLLKAFEEGFFQYIE